jgi:hypothetical protein
LNSGIFNNQNATRHFVSTLQQKNSTVEWMPGLDDDFLGDSRDATNASIQNSLVRNLQLNRVALLLVPPLQQQRQHPHAATGMMLKISHQSIATFAAVPCNAGASAIFKLLQARPALLGKRLKRPPDAAAAAAAVVATVSQRLETPPAPQPAAAAAAAAAAALNHSSPLRTRPIAACAAPTEKGSLKTACRTDSDDDADVDAVNVTFPAQQEVVVETFTTSTTTNTTTTNTTTTETTTTTTNESSSSGNTAALVQEASRCIESALTAFGNIQDLIDRGDHTQASFLI